MRDVNVIRAHIYSQIPFDVKSKKLSYSRIKDLLISVKEYVNNVANPKEPTEAMKLGSLFEILLLEPATVDARYFVIPDMPKFLSIAEQKKKSSLQPVSIEEQKAVWVKLITEQAGGKILITRKMFMQAHNMTSACYRHPLAFSLITQKDELQKKFELTVDGVDIHGYLDILAVATENIYVNGQLIVPEGHVYIVDIKKTNSIETSDIEKSCRDYKYYIQAFLYRKAIEVYIKTGLIQKPANQIEIPVFYIFQGDSAPYDTHIVSFGLDYDDLAKNEIVRAIKIFKTLQNEPEKLFFGINQGVTYVNPSGWQKQEFKESEKRSIYKNDLAQNGFDKFMIEKELDLDFIKPSCNVDIVNIFSHIESNRVPYLAPESKTSAVVVNEDSGAVKRKRRTKEEIEAAKAVDTNPPQTTIEAPSEQPLPVETPAETPAEQPVEPEQIPAPIEQPEQTLKKIEIEDLITRANSIKFFASGLYAVKKLCLILNFWPDMALIKLDELTDEQKLLISENIEIFIINEAQNA